MSKRKIFFRADASPVIGYGHFIRSLALADMLKDDFDITFFTTAPNKFQIDELNKVCNYIALTTVSNNEDFIYALQGNEIVVLDNYYYTTSYQIAIKKKGCKLVCIDDPHGIHYECDVLISHGFCKESDFDCDAKIKCLGPQWALLRAPFLQVSDNIAPRKEQIVVNIGGADPFNILEHILEELLKLNLHYKIKAIIGKSTRLSEDIINNVECLHDLTAQQMANLFRESSFGILPASTVSIEAMSCRLPLIIGYYVDNQYEGYKEIEKKRIAVTVGNLKDVSSETLGIAIRHLKDIHQYSIPTDKIKQNYISVFKSL